MEPGAVACSSPRPRQPVRGSARSACRGASMNRRCSEHNATASSSGTRMEWCLHALRTCDTVVADCALRERRAHAGLRRGTQPGQRHSNSSSDHFHFAQRPFYRYRIRFKRQLAMQRRQRAVDLRGQLALAPQRRADHGRHCRRHHVRGHGDHAARAGQHRRAGRRVIARQHVEIRPARCPATRARALPRPPPL